MIKILDVKDSDFDVYYDWIVGTAAMQFIAGGYSHVRCEGEIMEAEVVTFRDNSQGVMIGEGVNDPYSCYENAMSII
jgi:hypothetical protein